MASGWFFQGLLYMDSTERWFKILLDVVMTIVIFFFIILFIPSIIITILISFLIAHTINFLFNGHFMVIMKNLGKSVLTQESYSRFYNFLELEIKEKKNGIIAAAIIGSYVRNEFSYASDLDVRIIRRRGFGQGISICFLSMRVRARALLEKFPLDIYVFDSINSMSRLSKKEIPAIIIDEGGLLKEYYQIADN